MLTEGSSTVECQAPQGILRRLVKRTALVGKRKIGTDASQEAGRNTTWRYGGSNPPPRTKIKWPKFSWNEKVGLPECPYFRRWVLDFGAFSLRLHRWQGSDDQRAFHDHPWWFLTCVLRGSYVDITPDGGRDLVSAGSVRFRPATHQHTVKVLDPGTWTFLVTGPSDRRWSFWIDGKKFRRDKYFAVHGHHPCSDGGEPVRMRPTGERI